jgi:hypothetical protein
MSHFVNAARVGAAASLVGALTCLWPATATADPNTDKLGGMLSKGYTESGCTPAQVQSALAALDCGQNSISGGPTKARYILFSNSSDLSAMFKASMGLDTLTPCEPNAPVPNGWHYDNSPTTTAGEVACGTYKGTPEVIWTNDQNLMYGDAQGTNVSTLYSWWEANG